MGKGLEDRSSLSISQVPVMTTSEGSVILTEDVDEDVDVVVQPHERIKAITKTPSITANFFMNKNIHPINKSLSLIAFIR